MLFISVIINTTSGTYVFFIKRMKRCAHQLIIIRKYLHNLMNRCLQSPVRTMGWGAFHRLQWWGRL